MTEADLPLPPCKRVRRALVNDPEKTAILGLPDDLLLKIFEYLALPSLQSLRATCQRFYNVCGEPCLFPAAIRARFEELYGAIAPSERAHPFELLRKTRATLELLRPLGLSEQVVFDATPQSRVGLSPDLQGKGEWYLKVDGGVPRMVRITPTHPRPRRESLERTARLVGNMRRQCLAIYDELRDLERSPLPALPIQGMRDVSIRLETVWMEIQRLMIAIGYSFAPWGFPQDLVGPIPRYGGLMGRVIVPERFIEWRSTVPLPGLPNRTLVVGIHMEDPSTRFQLVYAPSSAAGGGGVAQREFVGIHKGLLRFRGQETIFVGEKEWQNNVAERLLVGQMESALMIDLNLLGSNPQAARFLRHLALEVFLRERLNVCLVRQGHEGGAIETEMYVKEGGMIVHRMLQEGSPVPESFVEIDVNLRQILPTGPLLPRYFHVNLERLLDQARVGRNRSPVAGSPARLRRC
jgi:hypothetical protein